MRRPQENVTGTFDFVKYALKKIPNFPICHKGWIIPDIICHDGRYRKRKIL
jgi:hypothetical protein